MKKAIDMTDRELEAALDAIKIANRKLEPVPIDKMARDMSEAEKRAFLDACRRHE